MPHVKAAPGKIVALDNGVTVTEFSSINVDVTLPLAAAALAASPPTIVQIDSATAPEWPSGNTVPVGVFSGAVTDASFPTPPPAGTLAIGDAGVEGEGATPHLYAKLFGNQQAFLATGVIGNNNSIMWEAIAFGSAGEAISIALVDPGGNNQALGVVVTGNAIVVNLATGSGGAITSTAAQIIAAIAASVPASALVTAVNNGASTGAAAVVAVSATPLAGDAPIWRKAALT